MLFTLRYADELRSANDLDLPAAGLKDAGVKPKEVELAKRLIDDMTGEWNPEAFKNTYHEDLMRRIDEKIKQGETKQITEPGKDGDEHPRSAEIIDLASLLKRSIEGGGKRSADRQPSLRRNEEKLHILKPAQKTSKQGARRKRA